MRAFLTVIMGAILLAGCAAKPTVKSPQAVSAQEDKDAAACLEQPLKKESYDERQKAFTSCMKARGYHDDKLYPTETAAKTKNPAIGDDLKNMVRDTSPDLAASEDYERAVADYNNCVLEHTANLSACEKQQAIMNGHGKVSSRLSLSQSYQTTLRAPQTDNAAKTTQGANTANATQASLSPVPPPMPQTPRATPQQAPAPMAPSTTSMTPSQPPVPTAPSTTSMTPSQPPAPTAPSTTSMTSTTSSRTRGPISLAPPTPSPLAAQVLPPAAAETVVDHPELVPPPMSDRPIPF